MLHKDKLTEFLKQHRVPTHFHWSSKRGEYKKNKCVKKDPSL